MRPPPVSLAAGVIFLFALALPFLVNALVPSETLPHKTLDIAAIILGATGVFAAMREAQRVYSGNSLPYLRNYATSQLATLQYVASIEESVLTSRVDRLRSEGAEGSLSAGYSKYVESVGAIRIWATVDERHRTGEKGLPPPLEVDWEAGVDDHELRDVRNRLKDQIDSYRSQYADWSDGKSQVERSAFEEFSLVASPFLVSAAVFIGLLSRLNQPN